MRTSGAGLKVLVVDDYPDAAQALGLLLEASGHRVRVATDAAAAEGAAVAFAPDVVALEVRLRRADGWALARRLVARLGARPAVVAVTGYAGAGTEERCRAAGIDHVLVKGDDPRALVAAIRSAGIRPVVRNPTDN
jgi:CheY-like chemotaxis protein